MSEQSANFALHNIQRFVFITDMESVYCAVRNGSFKQNWLCFVLKGLKYISTPWNIWRESANRTVCAHRAQSSYLVSPFFFFFFLIPPAFLCRVDVGRFITPYHSNKHSTPERVNVCSYLVAMLVAAGSSKERITEYYILPGWLADRITTYKKEPSLASRLPEIYFIRSVLPFLLQHSISYYRYYTVNTSVAIEAR
jgi:hypothetical protein